jgi:type II secretory pathway pseudopilin PulG
MSDSLRMPVPGTSGRVRRGVTIVELLVAMALILFIMTILSEAFVTAAQVFRDFKALGDMAGRLRTATQLLRDDLHGYHFDGNRRLSDPNFWANGPPTQGFFRIWQQAAAVQEGGSSVTDLEGVPSFTGTGTWLHFTVNKRGHNFQDFFLADLSGAAGSPLLGPIPVPGDPSLDTKYQEPTVSVFKSQWAEVAWFLKPNGSSISQNVGATTTTTNLYTLHRRQLLAVPDNYNLNWTPNSFASSAPPPYPAPASPTGYDEISWQSVGGNMYFDDPHDLTVPERRFGMNSTGGSQGGVPPQPTDGSYPISPNGNVSADVVLSDVISFDVRILVFGNREFFDLMTLPGAVFTNSTFNTGITITDPITGTPSASPVPIKVFDTWSNVKDGTYDYSGWNNTGTPSATTIPLRTYNGADIRIQAIQISLRIWDYKTEQARQVTLIVDL